MSVEKIPSKSSIDGGKEVGDVKVFLDSSSSLGDAQELFQDPEKLEYDLEKIDAFVEEQSAENLKLLLTRTGHGFEYLEKTAAELPTDVKYFLDKIIAFTDERALDIIRETVIAHKDDTNFPHEVWNFLKPIDDGEVAIDDSNDINFRAKLEVVIIHYYSPYPEVRSVTDLYQDPEENCETIRSYTIAFFWTFIAAGVNEFFSHRQPSISIGSGLCSVLMYPCGKAWELFVPNYTINFFGKKLALNPGRYTFKEQMFAALFLMNSAGTPYVSYNIVTQVKFYKQHWVSFGYQFLLVFATQFMGFSFAGLLRKFVIYPGRAVWPTTLPSIALNKALIQRDPKESINGWTVSRYKFFWICSAAMFCYFWLPNYLFQALSYFNWISWIAPNNFNLNMVVGSLSGLGLNPITTFDWNVATGVIGPIGVPFSTTLNMVIGAFIGFFVIIGVYYSNYKWTGYLPINSNGIFTNTGDPFQVTKVLGPDGKFSIEMYQAYSPPFYSAANLVLYGAFFFVYPFSILWNTYSEWSTVVYAFKLIGTDFKEKIQDIKANGFKFKSSDEQRHTLLNYSDAHSRKMSIYKEVPDSWFLLTLIISIVLGIIMVKVYPETQTPVWGIFFVIGINLVFLIPFCLLYSVTGISYGLNVLVELIVGYATTDGMALMTLKALGYNIDGQAENYISSQKIAHYVKVSPRALFRAQMIGTVQSALVFLGVVNWSMSNIDGMCEPHQKQKFTCPSERTFYSASVLWGYIGPKVVFDGIYPTMKYAFLIGFLAALAFIAWRRFLPKTYPRYFEPTVVVTGVISTYAPYNLSYVIPAFYIAFFFMYYLKNRYTAWFAKYTYVFSAAMSASIALSAIIIFFAVQYHPKNVNWWGNTVSFEGIEGGEGRQTLYDITATDRGYFGPEIGHYPTNESV